MADLLQEEMDAEALWRRLAIEERLESDGCRGQRALRALQRLLQALDGVNRQYEELPPEQREALGKADGCIGSSLGRLMTRWSADDSQEKKAAAAGGSSDDGPPYYVVAVNELIQHSAVGHRHAAHEHVLVASCPTRVFESLSSAAIVEWPCKKCGRPLQFATDTLDSLGVQGTVHVASHSSTVVFRCAMCKFHLCSECFDKDAPHIELPNSNILTPRLRIQRFFSLLLSHLETQSCYERVVRQLATEIRRRVFEIALFRIADIAALTRLFRELIEHPSAPLQLVMPLPVSLPTDNSIIPWFPPSAVTWKMFLLSFLGPFFSVTTISKELANSSNGMESLTPSLRIEWAEEYPNVFMENLVGIMQVLLAETQHPLVVDATLSWLATVVISINKRRLMNHDAEDRLDGFLINVNQILASISLQPLSKANQGDTSAINLAYHQGFVSIRGFGDKDYPEIPLREYGEREISMMSEEALLREMDLGSIAEFRLSNSANPDAQQYSNKSYYYPDLRLNYGVCCDRCSTPNFSGPRYKCAYCEDSDLCQQCFDVYSEQSAADPRRQGDGPDSRKPANFVAVQLSGRKPAEDVHNLDHVYLRVSFPVPLCNAMHFEWMDFDPSKVSYNTSASSEQKSHSELLRCAECSCSLEDSNILFKCSNCFDVRFVCAPCLALEEREHDPYKMHAPGHLYFSITRGWRRLYSPFAKSLHFRSLSFLSSLVPRVRFDKSSDMFHLTIKSMHHGPLATLDRYMRLVKEVKELESFCFCEEERFEFESMVRGTPPHEPRSNRGPIVSGRHRRRPAKMSSYYNSSKTRCREMKVTIDMIETHLSNPQNIATWVLFYAKTCSWLLSVISSSEDPRLSIVIAPSQAFCSFPEHFFVDLCDFVHFLGLKRVDETALEAIWNSKGCPNQSLAVVIIEPLVVVLAQVMLSPAFKTKRGLRTRIVRAFPSFLAFFSMWAPQLESVLESCPLLVDALALGVLKHLCDEEHRGLPSSNTSSVDATGASQVEATAERQIEEECNGRTTVPLNDDLPTLRSEVAVLIRYLWRLPRHQAVISQFLVSSRQRSSTELTLSEFRLLVDSMWGDLTRLIEEANDKITALRHLRDLLNSTDRARGVSLPIRPHMMDGYIALHSKQLRFVFRKLIEVLECTMWMAASAPFRKVMLSRISSEQCVRALCFVFSHVAQATVSGAWEFSVHLAADGQLVVAHLVTVILLFASGSCDEMQQVAAKALNLERESGSSMTHRLADLDAHTRWAVQSASLDEWMTNAPTPLDSKPRRRFLANLSCDGRFDGAQFNFCVQTVRAWSGGLKGSQDLIGDDCAKFFEAVMESAAHLRAIRESVEGIVAEAPDDFQDPVLGSLMTRPVLLPSGKIMDRRVLERHLRGNAGSDPFTRTPLTLEMVEPCHSLARDISAYISSKLSRFEADVAKDAQLVLGFEDGSSDSDGEVSASSRGVKRKFGAMTSSNINSS